MKAILKSVFSLFSVVKVLILFVLIFAVSFGYVFVTTKHLATAIIVGFVSSFTSFYFLFYLPKLTDREQYLLKELQKYATNMTFYLQSGYNVLKALENARESIDPTIRKDIDKTIEILQKEARLDTEHFKKYRFSSINIFHEILKIKYEVGGKAKELFTKANKNINFEIVKRDELYRRKKYYRSKIILMVGMTLSMPLILVFMAKELYDVYLSIGFLAIGMNALLFILVLINMYMVQKETINLDLQ